MRKQKLSLENLKVTSFVTQLNVRKTQTVKGGSNPNGPCDVNHTTVCEIDTSLDGNTCDIEPLESVDNCDISAHCRSANCGQSNFQIGCQGG